MLDSMAPLAMLLMAVIIFNLGVFSFRLSMVERADLSYIHFL